MISAVSSSSESDTDSDVSTEKRREGGDVIAKARKEDASPLPEHVSVAPKKSKKKAKEAPTSSGDVAMPDASAEKSPVPASQQAPAPKLKPAAQLQEDFSGIYLRRLAAELADDLDKVREAQDFKANSVPMLIHALRQGESMFSAEEKRRVVGAAGK
tara:strand:+ start:5461 stop:5931 length:471 start_codon:yes stop_codon:yes gene_type:complete